MKKIFLLLTFFSLILISSCNNEDVNTNSDALVNTKTVQDKDGVDIAVDRIKCFLNIKHTGSAETKSSDTENYDDIKVVEYKKQSYGISIPEMEKKSVYTKSATSTTTDTVSVYFIEYERKGERGFSIVSDDYRIPHVFALSENGSLADTVFNKGLAIYVNSMEDICQYKLMEFYGDSNVIENTKVLYNPMKPSILINESQSRHIGDDWIDITVYEVPEGYVTKDVSPLLKTVWHQYYPYNSKCNNGNSPTGCVPLATAEIMAHFKKPYTIQYWNELTVNINVSTQDAVLVDRVSTLLRTVGNGVNVSYGSESSGADFKDAVSYLRSVGINCSYVENINTATIINSLNNSKPVMLAGRRNNPFPLIYTNGHAWIVDGHFSFNYLSKMKYYEMYMPYLNIWDPNITESDWQNCLNEGPLWEREQWLSATYYHLHWGWGGQADGYYTGVDYALKEGYYYKYLHRMILF